MNKIRVFEAFSGYGSQAMSLKRLQSEYPDMLEFEFVGISEIEPSAIKAYNAVHGDIHCYGDISKIDWDEVPDFDLFTMSSPCQDFSVAGRQAGAEEGSGTRSSLLWECRKAIVAKRPKYILFENVSSVVSKKFIRGFHKWMAELESYGYTNYAKVLNSKDYGVPQNRERIFMLSIWGGGQSYHFPEPFKLEKRIKDIREPYGSVDESFYFKPEQLLRITSHCDRKVEEGCGFKAQFHTEDEISGCVTTRYGQRETDPAIKEGISIHPLNRKMEFQGFKSIQSDTAPCLTAHDGRGGEPCLWQRLSIYDNNAQAGRIYDENGISPALKCFTGGNSEPKILTSVRTEEAKELRKKGIEVFANRELIPREDGISNTITTVTKDNLLQEPCILGYTRDDNGKVCNRNSKDIANTVHTSTGNGGNTDQFIKEPAILQRPHGFNDGGLFQEVAPTITTSSYQENNLLRESIGRFFENLPDKTVLKDEDGKGYLLQDGELWRVRKLVPMECGRLMGCSDSDIQKMIDAGISKTALYSLFGNSIVVDVLYHIFRKLWIDIENESAQKSLFDI